MTRAQLMIMTYPEIRNYARTHYSSISRITDRKRLMVALDRQAEKEGGYRPLS